MQFVRLLDILHINDSIQKNNKKPEDFVLRNPSDSELWFAMQRWLAFDDPDSRLAQLRKLLSRQLTSPKLSSGDLAELPQKKLDELLASAFGSADDYSRRQSGLLNVFIAFEELNRFAHITFEALPFMEFPEFPAVEFLGNHFKLSASQKRWIRHAYCVAPDWTKLKSPGPWSNDLEAQFLAANLPTGSDDVKDVLAAYNAFHINLETCRGRLSREFLPNAIVLVEGATESLLLPFFAQTLKVDFAKLAVSIMVAGGANQVLRKYFQLKELLAIPIICILDADAQEQASTLDEHLRDNDRLYIVSLGEIEDIYDLATLVQLLNEHLNRLGVGRLGVRSVMEEDFSRGRNRKNVLEILWRERGLGVFDKVGFAKGVVNSSSIHVPDEAKRIIQTILDALKIDHAK